MAAFIIKPNYTNPLMATIDSDYQGKDSIQFSYTSLVFEVHHQYTQMNTKHVCMYILIKTKNNITTIHQLVKFHYIWICIVSLGQQHCSILCKMRTRTF